MTIASRTDAQGRARYRAVVRVRDTEILLLGDRTRHLDALQGQG